MGWIRRHWAVSSLLAVFLLATVVGVAATGSKTPTVTVKNEAAPVATSSAPYTPPPAPTEAPTTADAAPSTPSLTVGQEQAVAAAQGYLDLGSGFSEEGLLKQLTSQYGNGFSQADAKFAIRFLSPDWNAQAVEAAKGYLALGSGFSRASLIDQLTSVYGSGFTEAQAVYAANKVGL